MSGNKSVKVLCSGDVNGKFKSIVNRINAIVKKAGSFDVLFCVGEFFGDNEAENMAVINGEFQFPIPTYILGPSSSRTSTYYPDESCELSSSVTYLGEKGMLNMANGLVIGYQSGIEREAQDYATSSDKKKFEFDEKSVDDLLVPLSANSGFMGVDLLLTSVWPADAAKYSNNLPSENIIGSKMISRLASGLKPRYHFVGMGPHYERSPYRNHRVLLEPAQHVTRFVALSSVENYKKQKYLYAFTITPMRKMEKNELTNQPDNSTEFPYIAILEEFMIRRMEEDRRQAELNGASQFFYDMKTDPSSYEDPVDRGGRRKRGRDQFFGTPGDKRPRALNIQPDTCWFCLSNASTEKHLIVSVGSSCYTAMPKGPLNEQHLLVMSIVSAHVQSLVAAPLEVREEFIKFRDAYLLFCDKIDMALCVFERNYKTSHMQIQLVPVPKKSAVAARSSFLNAAYMKGIEFSFLKDTEQVWDLLNEGCPYFYVELPDGTRLLTKSMSQFPIQFGREVLASKALLDCEEKTDWRNCTLTKEQEAEWTEKLKVEFKTFDFTNDSDDDI